MTVKVFSDHGFGELELVFEGNTEAVIAWFVAVGGADANDPEKALVLAYKVEVDGVERPMTPSMFLARNCKHEFDNVCCEQCHICKEYLGMWASWD